MSLSQILLTRGSYKELQKLVNRYNRQVLKTHKSITYYHFRKLMKELNGVQSEDQVNTFTFLYGKGNNQISANITLEHGKLVLHSTVQFYINDCGMSLQMA